MENAITIQNLCVELKGFALKNINLEIPEGVVVGLIGKNGAGKTTLINTLTDVYLPSDGKILYWDMDLAEKPEAVKSRIGVVYDSLFYPLSMNGKNVAKIISRFYDDFDMEKFNVWMKRFGLEEKKRLIQFSKGQQMKFNLAMVLSRNPDILILDEPTAGLDPAARNDLIGILQEYMEDERKTILFSTHITSDLEKIADYIAVIDDGKLLLMEDKNDLLERYGIVSIEKEAMKESWKEKLVGLKANMFGYKGLTNDRSFFDGKAGVQVSNALIEDLLIYTAGSAGSAGNTDNAHNAGGIYNTDDTDNEYISGGRKLK